MSDPQWMDDRGLVRAPELLDRWFRTAGRLYVHAIRSPYVPAMLDRLGGVLALAALDAEQIRSEAMDVGLVFRSRNPAEEFHAAGARWAEHEAAMRSAIAAGASPDLAIQNYFERMAHTDPQALDTLTYMTTPQAPSTLWGWQLELETTKARYVRTLNAPQDTPIGSLIADVATLPDLPDSPEDVDRNNAASQLFDLLGTALTVPGSRGIASGEMVREPIPPLVTTVQSVPSTRSAPTVQEPPRSRSAVGPEVFDLRAPDAGPWAGVADDVARALDEPPRPPGSGTFVVEPWVLRLDQAPPVAELRPPVNTRYKYSKANNLLAMWASRWRRVFPMSQDARRRYGYVIPTDAGFKTDLYDHWEKRELARRLPDGSWEMFDPVRAEWLPESEIHKGHIMPCVDHHLMLVKRLGDDATRTPANESLRKQIVKTFMRNVENYVPVFAPRNTREGRESPWTYEGDHPDFRVGGQEITVLPTGERLRTLKQAPTFE